MLPPFGYRNENRYDLGRSLKGKLRHLCLSSVIKQPERPDLARCIPSCSKLLL